MRHFDDNPHTTRQRQLDQVRGNWSNDEERLAALCQELDALRDRVTAEMGEADLEHIRWVERLAKRLEYGGRALIHLSIEPVGFFLGVVALAAGHQLQILEIGHVTLHGAYDRLPNAGRFHSSQARWNGEIDEENWKRTHNFLHHGFTNVLHRDPDLQVGFMRWTSNVPYRWVHRFQVPLALSYLSFWWTGLANHAAGVNEVYTRPEDECVVLPDKSARSVWDAHRRSLRKLLPYKFVNYVVYPALAGPFFPKVLFGNWLADGLRDIYSAATIYCNHVGADVNVFGPQERARSRGEWYEMQILATSNFDVPHWASLLCGGLDRHIEHHIFPRLPANRLRQISTEVRDVCERHGVVYKSASWPRTLRHVFRQFAALGRPNPVGEKVA
jgi:linoleoyl-CoA desaturase